jgi:acetoin utilization protein AcuB
MISTLMTRRVVAVGPDMPLIDALRVMDAAGVRHLPVVKGDHCVGLLAEVDVLRQLVAHGVVRPGSTALLTAGEGCRRPSPALSVRATRATAAQLMLDSGCDAVLIMDDDHIHGIVTAWDLAASLVESAAGARAAEAQSSGGCSGGDRS